MPMPFGGFARAETPHPRILYARRGSFESLMAATLPTVGDIILTSVSGLGPIEILAGGLVNSSGVDGAAVSLVARAGGTLVGEARCNTDTAGIFIGPNTPCLFRLSLWRNEFRNAVSVVGVTEGGLVILSAAPQPLPLIVTTHTQRVGLGGLLIGFTSSVTGVAAINFTLDWLRVVEYPDGMP